MSEDEEAEFLFRCRRFANHFKPGDYPPQPKRTFERHWENRCESSWKKAFYMFTMGVPIFLANLACCAWLKFSYSKLTNGLVSGIVFISALVWAKTNKDWGWEIAKGSDARRSLNGKKNLKRGADVGGKINGLPFDWHARPKEEDDDDDDDDEEEEDDRIYFEYEYEDEEDKEVEEEKENTSSPTNKSDDSALERRPEDELEGTRADKDERVFVSIHDNA